MDNQEISEGSESSVDAKLSNIKQRGEEISKAQDVKNVSDQDKPIWDQYNKLLAKGAFEENATEELKKQAYEEIETEEAAEVMKNYSSDERGEAAKKVIALQRKINEGEKLTDEEKKDFAVLKVARDKGYLQNA